MTEEESIVGYYGKIPSKGDFVMNAVSMNFTDPWDSWLRNVLANSKSILGDRWMEIYLTAPVYHYALSSGVCGLPTWLGVMMPSVDSVGRYFPMTICKSFPHDSNALELIEDEKNWLKITEKLLLTCLEDDFSLDDFESELYKLKQNKDSNEDTITLKKSTMHRFEDISWCFPVHELERSSVINSELINSMLKTFYSTYSVWRTSGSDNVESSLAISEGLPPYKSFTAFMDGKWSERGWSDEQIIR